MNPVLFAFLLTLFAGLSTGFGSLLAFFTKTTNTKFLSLALGFSAGVMIYVSFVEILDKAMTSLIIELGQSLGSWVSVLSFFGGMLLIALIDKLIPKAQNPHEFHAFKKNEKESIDKKQLMRMGVFTALAITIHNFPEGIATFITALQAPDIAIAIAIAIAIHNIPEGIAVSVPIYYATGSKRKAFFYSFLSGLAEPAGAIVGYLILMPFLSETLFGVVFAMVAGIMVFISLDELLPASERFGFHHLSIYGLIAGMLVMALSLLLLL